MMFRSQPIDPLSTPEFTYSYARQFPTRGELLTSSTCHLSSTLPEGFLPAPPELATKKCREINILRGSLHQLWDGSEWIAPNSPFFGRTLLKGILHCSSEGPRVIEPHVFTAPHPTRPKNHRTRNKTTCCD